MAKMIGIRCEKCQRNLLDSGERCLCGHPKTARQLVCQANHSAHTRDVVENFARVTQGGSMSNTPLLDCMILEQAAYAADFGPEHGKKNPGFSDYTVPGRKYIAGGR